MKIKKILCPIDFSKHNQIANEYASILAGATGAEMVYFHVTVPEAPYGAYGNTDPSEMMAKDMLRLREVVPSVDGVLATWEVDFGPTAKRIVQFSNEHAVDLIVIGTHGRSGIERVLMGSVAEAVVRKAKCPVLAVKPHADAIKPSENHLVSEVVNSHGELN
ncbi:MAG: universal stress protein [Pirellulaceae bacterium]|nr:universal stress protein [Pirellulaceae bacterium]